ncbi:MAG: GntR family transcriptional regulator [Microbacterium sp. SCN 70-200]|uniref:GntR family transcriptional regulator n=1 Tax=unclassified Microbacterium TaxID=2609290 RepID=UPI00086A4E85|nr:MULTISPECIES: GntR family transcriptional regulator [unclassified Microbacterium]MBN9213353.1 GntR family transcriptional regulator [Microbacterium sp.]ODT40529.1 MAG: GntR family transcriptional regulator [Microbacterium sp. SCN 70-200]OJV85001.1 MAG: GntR family transcriptional regulator [Microbacterium sp. 70-16]
MLLRIDPQATTPLFTQLADAVRAEVVAGRVRAGERLPSARELAAALEVNLHTVLHAYQQLRDEGLVQMHRGRGAVVTAAAAQSAALHADLTEVARRACELGVSADAFAALARHAALTLEESA